MRTCLFTLQREPALPRILANKTSRLPTPAARSRRAWVPGFRVCVQRGCSRQGAPLPHRIAGSLPAALKAAVQGRAPRGCGVWASRCTHRPRNPPGPLPSLGLCFPHAGQANWLGRDWALRPVCRVCTCPAGPACGCLGVERAWRPELAGVQGLPRGGPQTRLRGGHLHLGAAQPALLARPPPSRPCSPARPGDGLFPQESSLGVLSAGTPLVPGFCSYCSLIPAVGAAFLHPQPTPSQRKGLGCVASSRKTSLMP